MLYTLMVIICTLIPCELVRQYVMSEPPKPEPVFVFDSVPEPEPEPEPEIEPQVKPSRPFRFHQNPFTPRHIARQTMEIEANKPDYIVNTVFSNGRYLYVKIPNPAKRR